MSQYEIVSTETTNSRLRLPKALYIGIIQYEHIIIKILKEVKDRSQMEMLGQMQEETLSLMK